MQFGELRIEWKIVDKFEKDGASVALRTGHYEYTGIDGAISLVPIFSLGFNEKNGVGVMKNALKGAREFLDRQDGKCILYLDMADLEQSEINFFGLKELSELLESTVGHENIASVVISGTESYLFGSIISIASGSYGRGKIKRKFDVLRKGSRHDETKAAILDQKRTEVFVEACEEYLGINQKK